jgi:4-hydroxy-4-methyl-2-oxoglutarate aldolase
MGRGAAGSAGAGVGGDRGAPSLQLLRTRLWTAVLCDVLAALGLHQQIMSSQVRSLNESLVLCGRARTGDFKDVYHADERSDPYELVITLVDGIKRDDVLVLACGKSGRIHPLGGAQAAAAAARGAAGCVTDGLVRDVGQIRALGFPSFAAGNGAIKLRGRGRLVAIDVPVQCGGVWVSPGDLIFGDVDGVIVVPQVVEQEVIAHALERAELERHIVEELRAGASIIDLYRKYHML